MKELEQGIKNHNALYPLNTQNDNPTAPTHPDSNETGPAILKSELEHAIRNSKSGKSSGLTLANLNIRNAAEEKWE